MENLLLVLVGTLFPVDNPYCDLLGVSIQLKVKTKCVLFYQYCKLYIVDAPERCAELCEGNTVIDS